MLGCHCEEQSDEAIFETIEKRLPQPFSRLRNDRNVICDFFTPTFAAEPITKSLLTKL